MSLNVVDKELSVEAQTRFVVEPTIFVAVLPLNDATPSVLSLSRFKGNGTVNTITNFKHGQDGQSIKIRGDGTTTIANNSNIKTATGSNTLLELDKVYEFTYYNNKWTEQTSGTAEAAPTPGNFHATAPITVSVVGSDVTYGIGPGTFPGGGSYTFQTPLLVSNGTLGTPGFGLASGTGWYSPDGVDWRLARAGVNKILIEATRTYFAGNFEGDGAATFAETLTLGSLAGGSSIIAGGVTPPARFWISVPGTNHMEFTSRTYIKFRVDSTSMGPLDAFELTNVRDAIFYGNVTILSPAANRELIFDVGTGILNANGYIIWKHSNLNRWVLGKPATDAGDFTLYRYDNAGGLVGVNFDITRATGGARFYHSLRIDGTVGIISSPLANIGLYLDSTAAPLSGNPSQRGIYVSAVGSSDGTTGLSGVSAATTTAAAAYTSGYVASFYARPHTKGSGSTITNAVSFYAENQTVGTNNYGFYSLQSTGYAFYGSGVAPSYFGGSVGIGVVPTTATMLLVTTTNLSTTIQHGLDVDITGTSEATVNIIGITARARTPAAAVTFPDVYGIHIHPAVKGSGSTITNVYGLNVADQTQGTTNFAVRTNQSVGYAYYGAGSASSGFGGDIHISSSFAIRWKDSITSTERATIRVFSNSLAFEVAGSEGMRIDAARNIGIGTTDIEAWHSSYGAVQLGGRSMIMFGLTTQGFNFGYNAYYDGTWKHRAAAQAAMISLDTAFQVYVSSTAGPVDGAITLVQALNVDYVGGARFGFHGATPITKPAVTGSRGGNAALASFLTAMANYGLITDSTT
jgi:hypothetical protein